MKFAISEVEKNTLLSPEDYLPVLYMARLNIILGKESSSSPHNDAALALTERSLEISPTFVRAYYEVAQAYLNKVDLENAFEFFSRAQQLNPEVGISYWYMGITKVQLGDLKGGLKHIEDAVANGYALKRSDVERMIGIYAQVGDFTTVITLLENLLEQEPEKSQYWASLGAAYEATGRINEAVEALRKAIELDEGFREDGEAKGYEIYTGGTDSHMLVMRAPDGDGKGLERLLEKNGIIANRNSLPGDISPLKPSGIRFGTPYLTTRGLRKNEMKLIASLIHRIIEGEDIKNDVRALVKKFPIR